MRDSWEEIEHWWGVVWKRTSGAFTSEISSFKGEGRFYWKVKELGDTVDVGIERNYVQALVKINRAISEASGVPNYAAY